MYSFLKTCLIESAKKLFIAYAFLYFICRSNNEAYVKNKIKKIGYVQTHGPKNGSSVTKNLSLESCFQASETIEFRNVFSTI